MIEALLKEPKEYGIDNECWNYVGIKDVCFFQEGPGLRVWQWKDEGIKVINIKNIIGTGEIILDNTDKYISLEEFEDKYRHFEVQEGDILVVENFNKAILSIIYISVPRAPRSIRGPVANAINLKNN